MVPADEPSTKLSSAAVEVTPSRMLSSAVVAVTPSMMLSSSAVAETLVPPMSNVVTEISPLTVTRPEVKARRSESATGPIFPPSLIKSD